jgi:integrase
MAKVTLRKKPIAKGRQTLYLDFYPTIAHPNTGKQVRREYLKLYLFDKPRLEEQKEHNRETNKLAENIRALRQIEIQNRQYGFLSDSKRNESFVAYFRNLAKKRTGSNSDNWNMAVEYFATFAGDQVRFLDITEALCNNYRGYLMSGPSIRRKGISIARNTAVSYFSKFRTVLKAAYKAGYLTDNLNDRIEGIKPQETHREYLTLEELQQLAKAGCDDPVLKRAALFSVLTGLRFSDIKKLVWDEVRGTATGGYYLQFRQEKTDGAETLPISDQAFSFLGDRKGPHDIVFEAFKYSSIDSFLPGWLLRAEISKHITFHSFRHTFATLQLTKGTDIYTVSKMLGHRNLKTTQVYAKIIDAKKVEAAGRIRLEL